jgi:hypothetical protein
MIVLPAWAVAFTIWSESRAIEENTVKVQCLPVTPCAALVFIFFSLLLFRMKKCIFDCSFALSKRIGRAKRE